MRRLRLTKPVILHGFNLTGFSVAESPDEITCKKVFYCESVWNGGQEISAGRKSEGRTANVFQESIMIHFQL